MTELLQLFDESSKDSLKLLLYIVNSGIARCDMGACPPS